MKKLFYILIISYLNIANANGNMKKTIQLHNEINANIYTHLNKETCPVLFAMVEDIAAKLKIVMPHYITLFSAEYIMINEQGVAEKIPVSTIAKKDLLGDLHICKEALISLSYEEIRGILSIALVDERIPLTFGTFILSFIVTIGFIYCLDKKCNLKLGKIFLDISKSNKKEADQAAGFIGVILSIPSLITSNLVYQNLQKKADLQAAGGIGTKNTIEGIKALKKMYDAYHKEGLISRILNAFQLKSFVNTIFYPIRPFTFEERIQYLQV